jgi:glycosyltransferase involved in cell wall biosynthesis
VFAGAGNPNFERNTSRVRFQRDRWLYEYGLRNVDRIFVQNMEQAALCLRNFGRDTILVPNCYPGEGEKPSGEKGEVLWVSTIRKLKRPERFLELAAALPAYKFKMIGGPGTGPGEQKLFESVKARAHELHNLEFLGFVPYAEIDKHFDTAALVVNTSESEGFPNTFLQAWARAVPTISFVDCGARVDGRPVGCIAGSMEEMVGLVASMLSDDAKRSHKGEICRQYVEHHHSLDYVLDIYEEIFKQLAGH